MRIAVLGAALLLSACASHEMVTILPPSDGHIGGVVVHPLKGGQDVVLDKVYASGVPGDARVTTATAESVDKQFHDAMGAFPKEPKTYTLFFERDNADLTPDMSKQFGDIEALIIGRDQPAEIVITGHTDTSGSQEYNDKLSLRRADLIKGLFIKVEGQDKLDQRHITITTAGRGLRDARIAPNVNCKATPDETSCHDARNVEITVQ